MVGYERDYGVARFVFGIFEVIGWGALGIGALLALFGAQALSQAVQYYGAAGWGVGLVAIAPGLGVAVGGLFAVSNAQTGRAHVDTAEMTRELLRLARQSANPRSGDSEPRAAEPAPVMRAPRPPLPSPPPVAVDDETLWNRDPAMPRFDEDGEVKVSSYRSLDISIRRDGYYAGGQRFDTRGAAKAAIDEAYARRGQRGT